MTAPAGAKTATKPKTKAPKVAESKGAVAVRKPQRQRAGAVVTPQNMLAAIAKMANDPKIDPGKIEKMLAMQERIVARDQEVQFNEALHRAQAAMPRIFKRAKNESTNSFFATLETVSRAVNPIAHEHGFSMSFSTETSPLPGHYREICYLSHTSGHTRKYDVDVPADTHGPKGTRNKTDTHGFGSSMSYGRRYLKIMIFDLVLIGEDDDGQAAGGKPVALLSDEQCTELVDLLEAYGMNRKKFLQWAAQNFGDHINSFGQIPASKYAECRTVIINRAKQISGG